MLPSIKLFYAGERSTASAETTLNWQVTILNPLLCGTSMHSEVGRYLLPAFEDLIAWRKIPIFLLLPLQGQWSKPLKTGCFLSHSRTGIDAKVFIFKTQLISQAGRHLIAPDKRRSQLRDRIDILFRFGQRFNVRELSSTAIKTRSVRTPIEDYAIDESVRVKPIVRRGVSD